MANTEYSKRLGCISPTQFQLALDRFGLGTFLYAEPILFGLFGQNVFVNSTKGEFVLRGDPHFSWQFPTEHFFAKMLYDRTTVPAPWPYLIDPTTDIFGWSYVLMPRLPGLQIAQPEVKRRLTLEDRISIARALGENLANMQHLIWPFVGRYSPETDTIQAFELLQEMTWPFPPQESVLNPRLQSKPITFSERIIARIRHLIACSCTYNNRTTASDVIWVEKMIMLAQEALSVPFQPCFVMEDYKGENTVLACANGLWRVSGVFDLMEAHFGDGEADLSRTVGAYLDEDPQLAQEFVQAYSKRRPPRAGFAERFVLYMLHDRLIIWEYLQRTGTAWQEKQQTFQQWAMPYTSCYPALQL